VTILAIASFEKGHEFLRECKRQGARTLLLTSASLKDTAEWPTEAIDEIYYMPDVDKRWDRTATLHAVAYLARTEAIDRLVPLDDFDLEMAAFLREHLRIPGMGETTTRYFRDKLAMRMRAREEGLRVPEFVGLINHGRIHQFTRAVPPPWVLKPRFLAGAIGIRKIHDPDQLWQALETLGDQQSYYVLEAYVPGAVVHVDSIVSERRLVFASASAYGAPPLDVSHGGGVFTSKLLRRGTEFEAALLEENRKLMTAMGLVRGVSHSEFIVQAETGDVHFLETSARVGGANIADLIAAGRGINLWAEWARIELLGSKGGYAPPAAREEYAGLLVALSRQEHPDTSGFNDPEVVWRMAKRHHIGLIVQSPDPGRVEDLLASYTHRVELDFLATAPPRENAVD